MNPSTMLTDYTDDELRQGDPDCNFDNDCDDSSDEEDTE